MILVSGQSTSYSSWSPCCVWSPLCFNPNSLWNRLLMKILISCLQFIPLDKSKLSFNLYHLTTCCPPHYWSLIWLLLLLVRLTTLDEVVVIGCIGIAGRVQASKPFADVVLVLIGLNVCSDPILQQSSWIVPTIHLLMFGVEVLLRVHQIRYLLLVTPGVFYKLIY